MSPFILEWLNLLIRWFHLIVGIGWIGASFYFVALDFSLKAREHQKKGVLGSAWEVHGGGFYHTEKFLVAPPELPKDLIWYKWEAYLTFASGIALMIVQFYWHADLYMVDVNVLDIAPQTAIIYSMVSLAAGWFIYDAICKSSIGQNTNLLMLVTFLLIMAASYFYTHVFSARASLIHVGAFIGTIMAANVFSIIIPNQKKIVASLLNGQKPDARYGKIGKQRSIHNTYLTLPVLVMMVSGHYPLLSNHPQAWLLVGLIIVGGAILRHLIIKHEIHAPLKSYVWTLPVIFITLAAAMYMTMPASTPVGQKQAGDIISDKAVMGMINQHCISCHAITPSHESFDQPPKNVVINSIESIRKFKDLIHANVVQADTMPLGNETNMTQAERDQLAAWLAAQE
ncbi:MAG: urate hydroxylase PuuD [Rhizobiales bacterium]|nr:urate hydroxylase PuuD [Hyphomicrobiales bacterium]NRB14543.1 urate hydroxylase PuuD [Hyphomicrobiales bacterium]